jgi:hypothetical protein
VTRNDSDRNARPSEVRLVRGGCTPIVAAAKHTKASSRQIQGIVTGMAASYFETDRMNRAMPQKAFSLEIQGQTNLLFDSLIDLLLNAGCGSGLVTARIQHNSQVCGLKAQDDKGNEYSYTRTRPDGR